jgi:glycosyltransferase involved in cell wall biosynthesis
MGKPVVASDLPSLREVLADRDNARLVPPEDPAALAVAVNELVRDRGLAAALGRRAQALAESRFGWTQRSAQLMAMIERGLDV